VNADPDEYKSKRKKNTMEILPGWRQGYRKLSPTHLNKHVRRLTDLTHPKHFNWVVDLLGVVITRNLPIGC
jgi:hypothetical protein